MCLLQLNKVNPLFSSLSFQRVLCSTLLIWSVVTPENNTDVRHFRWASCLSPRWQEKSWYDVMNHAQPRPNLIFFSLGNVSKGGDFFLLWIFPKKSRFQTNENIFAESCSVWCKVFFGPKKSFGVIGTLNFTTVISLWITKKLIENTLLVHTVPYKITCPMPTRSPGSHAGEIPDVNTNTTTTVCFTCTSLRNNYDKYWKVIIKFKN